jgi:hypothetical protein
MELCDRVFFCPCRFHLLEEIFCAIELEIEKTYGEFNLRHFGLFCFVFETWRQAGRCLAGRLTRGTLNKTNGVSHTPKPSGIARIKGAAHASSEYYPHATALEQDHSQAPF